MIALSSACSDGQATSSPQADGKPIALVSSELPLAGRVTDAAAILDKEQEAALTRQLAALEQRTGHQMIVVTVPDLGDADVADYARALGNRWGIGRKGHNDGVILLIAPNERRVRIEVGTGLEKKLPDSLCKTILDRDILPRFREADLPGGIQDGVTSLIQELER